jgi:hypothetical protein
MIASSWTVPPKFQLLGSQRKLAHHSTQKMTDFSKKPQTLEVGVQILLLSTP